MRDSTGKNIGEDTLIKLVQLGFQDGGFGSSKKTTLVSEIHYAPEHLALAKAVLPFVPSAQLVKDPSITNGVMLTLGQFFPGLVVDPATAATTLPPVPVEDHTAGHDRSEDDHDNVAAGEPGLLTGQRKVHTG